VQFLGPNDLPTNGTETLSNMASSITSTLAGPTLLWQFGADQPTMTAVAAAYTGTGDGSASSSSPGAAVSSSGTGTGTGGSTSTGAVAASPTSTKASGSIGLFEKSSVEGVLLAFGIVLTFLYFYSL